MHDDSTGHPVPPRARANAQRVIVGSEAREAFSARVIAALLDFDPTAFDLVTEREGAA